METLQMIWKGRLVEVCYKRKGARLYINSVYSGCFLCQRENYDWVERNKRSLSKALRKQIGGGESGGSTHV
jgi:hypothetical protein